MFETIKEGGACDNGESVEIPVNVRLRKQTSIVKCYSVLVPINLGRG